MGTTALQTRSTNKKLRSVKMNYFKFLVIGFFVLTIETTSLSAFRLRQANGTNAPSIAPSTSPAGPGSLGSVLFAELIAEFDAFKAKDEVLTAEMEALKAKVETLTAKVQRLTSKDTTLTSENAALKSKVDALAARVDNHGEKRKQELKSQGFSIISGRAVKYFSTSKTWDSARAACHGMKGFLLTVDSNTMTNWAKQHGSFWIGLNDKATNDVMVWDSGRPLIYENWHSGEAFDDAGESKHKNQEKCVEILNNNGVWNDNNCDLTKPYACEIWYEV